MNGNHHSLLFKLNMKYTTQHNRKMGGVTVKLGEIILIFVIEWIGLVLIEDFFYIYLSLTHSVSFSF